jgi:hypothetical protein
LTCRKLYQFSKFKYPEHISLYELSPLAKCDGKEIRFNLGDLLEDWVGPLYRRRVWSLNSIQRKHYQLPPQFLIRSIYGSFPGDPEEVALAKRYLEYYSSQRQVGSKTWYILPNPYNKAAGYWWIQAKECIMNDAKDFRGRAIWDWNAWMGFWMPSEVFLNIGYMEKLKVLQWFEEMVWLHGMQILPGGSPLQEPSVMDKLWWFGKRHMRWVTWWAGSLPLREPFPRPEREHFRFRRQFSLRSDSFALPVQYR